MAVIRFSPEVDPISGMLELQRELARALESPLSHELGSWGRGVFPAINVFADRDGHALRMEVPGVSPDSIHIETQGNTLRVAGKREMRAPKNGSFHRRERSFGEFSRSISLPQDLDVGRADASYKNGMLTVRIPKREEAKPRQISVKAA